VVVDVDVDVVEVVDVVVVVAKQFTAALLIP
jgi:hypothetical protein